VCNMIGEEVLAQGQGLQPDMVLVDLAMPGLSGLKSVAVGVHIVSRP
jgi:CheY-like chemotaxis protein